MVLLMEEVATRLDLDELFHKLFLWDVSKDNILRVLVEDCELVRDTRWILFFLSLNALLEFLLVADLDELGMLKNLSE